MVIMASGIARGRVRTTTTTTGSCNMAVILQAACSLGLLCTSLVLASMLWSTDTCQNKVSADHSHVTISRAHRGQAFFLRWPLTRCWFFDWMRAHDWLTCWKQGRIVRKPVNAHPGLDVNRIITVIISVIIISVFAAYFVYMVIIETQNRRPNNIQ